MLTAMTAGAQNQSTVSGTEDQINFAYAGDDTRLGIGVDNEGELIGDFLKSFNTSWNSNWMGEVWLSDGAGGLKLDYHRLSGANQKGDLINNEDNLRIWKYFAAIDQNTFDDRKFTIGFGSEAQDKFWNINLSSAVTGSRLTSTQIQEPIFNEIFGQIDGRDFVQTEVIESIIRTYEHPYDWGIGGRLGKFFDNNLVRLTGGLDYEEGDFDSDQFTASINLEKYFHNTGHSLALAVEQIRKSGDFETDRDDTRANLMYRYDFGKNHLPTTVDEEVQVLDEDRLKQLQLENRQLVQNQVDLSSMAFFDLDKSFIRDDAAIELKSLVEQIKATELASSINIIGHTCDIASDAYNLDLSTRRAQSAKAFFVANGIDADIIQSKGMGESQPAYDNNSSEQPKNRRVEISFLTIEKNYIDVEIADEDLPMKWVKRKVEAPAPWINRALRNPAQHKRTVDVYKFQETETNTTLGEIIFLNADPIANDDGITIDRNSSGVAISVLANDSDEDDGDVIAIESVTQASNGTVINNGDILTYIPNSGFIGTDTFTYTITDQEGASDTATVTITVNNIAPIAVNDVATSSGDTVVIFVTANDSDPDGTSLQLLSTTNPTNGVISSNGGNEIEYTPNAGFVGIDTFTYTINDVDGATSTATVTVTVNDPNTAPIAVDDSFFTTMNTSRVLNLLNNDSDPDGDVITLVSVNSEGTLGTVIDINADGTVTYVPPTDWCGTDTFTYTRRTETTILGFF